MSITRRLLLFAQTLLYVLAGIGHFRKPAMYASIVPHFLPWALQLVAISGVAEIVLGIGLLIPVTRRWAAWGIILLLIAVFPANIQMTMDYSRSGNPFTWLTIVRLPVQLLLIAMAYKFTKRQ